MSLFAFSLLPVVLFSGMLVALSFQLHNLHTESHMLPIHPGMPASFLTRPDFLGFVPYPISTSPSRASSYRGFRLIPLLCSFLHSPRETSMFPLIALKHGSNTAISSRWRVWRRPLPCVWRVLFECHSSPCCLPPCLFVTPTFLKSIRSVSLRSPLKSPNPPLSSLFSLSVKNSWYPQQNIVS